MDHFFAHDLENSAIDDGAERTGSRDSLLLTAKLRLPGLASPVSVRVRNLSSGGLMAEYAGNAATGDTVEVEVRGIGRTKGHIAWVTDGRIGIAFTTAIDPLLARKPVTPSTQAEKRHAPL